MDEDYQRSRGLSGSGRGEASPGEVAMGMAA